MEESELVAEASQIVRAMAPGISAALGTWLRGGQDRRNLEADRAVVHGMLESGLSSFSYRGLTMEFEVSADAHQEEIERLVTNTVSPRAKRRRLFAHNETLPAGPCFVLTPDSFAYMLSGYCYNVYNDE